MPLTTYYFEGLDFASATSLYTDAAMTVYAADGYYSGGGIVRQQVGGFLLSSSICSTCYIGCGHPQGTLISNTGSEVGKMTLIVNAQATLTGAMAVEFYPGQLPAKVTWSVDGGASDSVGLYSSEVEGYVTGFIGTETAGITNALGSNGASFVGSSYLYDNNTVTWGADDAYTVPAFGNAVSGDCTLINASPGGDMKKCVIPIPITVAGSEVTITIENCLANPTWSISVPCQRALTSLPSTTTQANEADACLTAVSTVLYRMAVSADLEIGVHDWVFEDNEGVTKLTDGWYGVTIAAGHVAIEVANGVVLSISAPCGP